MFIAPLWNKSINKKKIEQAFDTFTLNKICKSYRGGKHLYDK